jgi:hypothetical protein
MPSFSFIGPTYQARSLAVDGERSINLFPELVESGNDASRGTKWYLLGTPGKILLGALGGPNAALSWSSTLNGAKPDLFAIAGTTLYKIDLIAGAGVGGDYGMAATSIGTVTTTSNGTGSQLIPCQVVVINPLLLFVVAGGNAYVAAFGAGITGFQFGPAANPPTSNGTGYAVGDTGIVLGSSGIDAVYTVTFVDPTINGSIIATAQGTGGTISSGSGYAVGDTGTINGGNGDATYLITAVGSVTGSVLLAGYTITSGGSGYSVANNVATTPGGAQPGGGAGFEIDITQIGTSGGAVTGITLTPGAGYTIGNNIPTQRGGTQPGAGFGFTLDITAVGAAAWQLAQQTIPASTGTPNFVSYATYMDGYVIVNLAPNDADPLRRQVFISGLNDPSTWDPLDVFEKEGQPDPVVAVFAAYETLLVFGAASMEIFYDVPTGAAQPFQRVQGGGLIECGLASPWTIVKMDGTVVWLGTDNRGGYVVWELRGMTPTRISNHAIETLIADFNSNSATAFSYQEEGHFFYVLHFPLDDRTIVCDTSTIGPDGKPMWHERLHWDGSMWRADLGRYHAFVPGAVNRHVLADPNNGNLYIQRLGLYDDNGTAIRRLRASPHLTDEKRRTLFSRFRLFMQTGISVPATGQSSAPLVSLRLSDDGGYTWGPYLTTSAGKLGEVGLLVEWYRMGKSRNRVYEVTIEELIPIALVDAFSEAIPTVTR